MEYKTILKQLNERRRAAAAEVEKIDSAIEIVRSLAGDESLSPPHDDLPTTVGGGPTRYAALSLKEAIKAFLREKETDQPAKSIKAGLLAGGYETESKNFYRMVYNTLVDMAKKGYVYRKNAKWGIRES